jgi:hypothetical protein
MGLFEIRDGTVRTLAVGELDGRVVAAYAPDFDGGSGFVKLVEMSPGLDALAEQQMMTVLPEATADAVPLSELAVWSIMPGKSGRVHALVNHRSLWLLEVSSGTSWGTRVDERPAPELVSEALGWKVSGSIGPAFSILEADVALPIRIDEVEAATQNLASHPRSLHLRRDDPRGWPATAMTRGFWGGRAVLVLGSYHGVLWIWDLANRKTLAGPFADVPDEIELRSRVKMAPSRNPITNSVAIGDVGGRAVVAAAVAGRVHLYDAETGAGLSGPAVSATVVVAVALGDFRGRSILVTGSLGGVVAVWDVNTGQRLAAVTLDSEITGVWKVQGADSVAARDKTGRLLVFDLVGNP